MSLDLDALLQQIISDLLHVIPEADIRVIYLYDEHYQALVPRAYVGYDTNFLSKIRLKSGESISGWVYKNGQSCLSKTPMEVNAQGGILRTSSQRLYAQATNHKTIQSNICVPLRRSDEKIIGTITLSSTRAPFTQDDLDLLEDISCQTVEAINNASTFSSLQVYETNNQWLLENLPVGIFANDQDGHVVYQNCQALQITGYDPEDLQNLHVRDLFVDPDEYDVILMLLAQKDNLVRESRLQRKDRQQIWVKATWQATRNESGSVGLCLVLLEDRTESYNQVVDHQALELIRDQVWYMQSTADIEKVLVALNNALKQVGISYGYLGINIVHDTADGFYVRTYQLTTNGEWYDTGPVFGAEIIKGIWREGTTAYRQDLWVEDIYEEMAALIDLFKYPVRAVVDVPFSHGTLALNSSQPKAFSPRDIAFLEQVTNTLSDGFSRLDDLKALATKEEQLQQAQKMDAIGHLAGGVAHDFNNLITIISGYSQLLLHDLSREDPRRLNAEEIHDASERAEKLVKQLLRISRRKTTEPGPVHLNEVVDDLDKLFGRLLGEDIELCLILDPDIELVYVDRGQLDQIIINLALNARDAMPTGGTLSIETANVEVGRQCGQLELQPGRYIMLTISDTGIAMDEETQTRIFEPFFTTKKHNGTGLGLAIVHEIIKQNKGQICVYSKLGQGTNFQIYLPRCTTAKEVTTLAVQESSVTVGGLETILLVEDDDMVRKLTYRFLDESGYQVLEARHGQEA